MIPRPKPERFRLRRTMMFMNAQKPGLIKDAYIYGVDSIMLDLEDAVAENQKDAARFSLYHALKTIDYGDTEVIVRINGLDTPHWQEDVRVCVAGGADGIRIAKCESAQDVLTIEKAVEEAEKEFGVEVGRTLLRLDRRPVRRRAQRSRLLERVVERRVHVLEVERDCVVRDLERLLLLARRRAGGDRRDGVGI